VAALVAPHGALFPTFPNILMCFPLQLFIGKITSPGPYTKKQNALDVQ
jgi:hypothetical protein